MNANEMTFGIEIECFVPSEALLAEGWTVGNLDATIIAEAPRMAPHIARMQANIEHDLGLREGHVSVKATTTEKLGFTGRGEGIAAQAVCLLLPLLPTREQAP